MATYTSNLNLYMPDSTDDFGEFREEHNDNMVKIDNAIGGGGGSGGHTIIDPNGNSLPQESGLQFTGGVTVTDDSVNGKTVVNISGGGGNVYGAFIDPNRSLTSSIAFSNGTPINYTATEDCIVEIYNDSANVLEYRVDGLAMYFLASGSYTLPLPLKKGQTLTSVSANSYSGAYHAYGLTQGTNGIFTPIIYSDTERVVGVWRDNKPLYQRTFVFETPVAVSYSSFTDTTIDSTDIENIVDNHATHADGTNYGSLIADPTRQSHTKVGLQTNRNGNNANVKTLTIRYTKISDVAGSGTWNTDGVPTVHYSTSEQVIGTWIGGKPLYEKTVHVANSQGSFSDYVTIETMTDLKMSVSADFTARRYIAGTGEWFINGNGTARAEQNDTYYVGVRVFNQSLQYVIGGYGTQITDLWITVRYTKVTD